MNRKQLSLSPTLERVAEKYGQGKGRDGKFSSRLSDVYDRYETLIKLTIAPDVTEIEKTIINQVCLGNAVTHLLIKHLSDGIMDCSIGSVEDRSSLAKKIEMWTPAEKLAIIEMLGI